MIQDRRTGVAQGPELENTVPEFKTGPQTSWALPDHKGGLTSRLSVASPSLMEDTRRIPCFSLIPLL